MLNNNSPTEMHITPTLYHSGRDIAGDTVVLQPAETRWIAVRDLLPSQARPAEGIDALELRFFGYLLDLRTQIVTRRSPSLGSVDVLFTGMGEFRSRKLSSVWIVPAGGRAILTLGNTTDEELTASLQGDHPSRRIRLAPHETLTLVRPGSPNKPSPDSLTVISDGPVGALRAGGYLEFGRRTFGLVRFYDTATARQAHLSASNLRVGNTDVQMALLNTSDRPVVVQPEARPATREGGQPILLPSITVLPRQSVAIDTRGLRGTAFERASIRVVSNGAPGNLVGYVAAIDRSSLVAYELPLREPGPMRQSTGNYPWRLDGDYSSVVSIVNVGATTAAFSAIITYAGGQYRVPPETLPPGATATFDIRDVRARQIPGLDGGLLPLEAEKGQFKWSIGGPVNEARLNGRMEIVSRSTGQSSSYSCAQCCPDSYSSGILQPSAVWTPSGWSTQFTVLSQLRTCSGSEGGQLYAWADSWGVANPSVASVDTTGYGTANANGLSGGHTGIAGHWTGYQYVPYNEDCHEVPVDGGGYGEAKVQTPTSLRVVVDYYDPQNFNDYRRHRRYLVVDQNGADISRAGMAVTESVTPWNPNGCNFPAPDLGEGETDSAGGFYDRLHIKNQPGCIANDACVSRTMQTIKVDGHTVANWPLEMGCSGMTINNQ